MWFPRVEFKSQEVVEIAKSIAKSLAHSRFAFLWGVEASADFFCCPEDRCKYQQMSKSFRYLFDSNTNVASKWVNKGQICQWRWWDGGWRLEAGKGNGSGKCRRRCYLGCPAVRLMSGWPSRVFWASKRIQSQTWTRTWFQLMLIANCIITHSALGFRIEPSAGRNANANPSQIFN